MATYIPQRAEDTVHTTGDAGVPILGVSNEAATARHATDGDYGMIAVDSVGRVGIADLGGSITVDGSVNISGFPDNEPFNIAQYGGSAVGVSNGFYVRPGTLASFPVTDNLGSLTVDAPVSTPVFVTPTPSTTGGWSVSSSTALSSTKTAVKASAGTFGGYMIYNPNATVIYVQVFDVAIASITVGTTTPTYVLSIPATSGANLEIGNGIKHSTEINVAATTTPTGSTAPGTALVCAFWYK